MMKNNYLETKQYAIECLGPVHIGSGEKVKPFEYLRYEDVVSEGRGRNNMSYVGFVDSKALMTLLKTERDHEPLLNKFSRDVQELALDMSGNSQLAGFDLYEWLKNNGIPHNMIKSIVSSKAKVLNRNASTHDIARQLHRVCADGTRQPYIPGSSIKGALRTAILRHFITNEVKKKYWSSIEQSLAASSNVEKALEEELFNCLGLTADITDAVNSIMKGILVSDAFCSPKCREEVIVQKNDISTKLDKRTDDMQDVRLPLYRECIPGGTTLRFSMTLDHSVMRGEYISSLDDILEWQKTFFSAVKRQYVDAFTLPSLQAVYKEASLIGKNRDEYKTLILLGGGTGFLNKTVLYDLASSKSEGQEVLAKYFDSIFKHDHVLKDEEITPRTLKLGSDGTGRHFMGLCQIREVP